MKTEALTQYLNAIDTRYGDMNIAKLYSYSYRDEVTKVLKYLKPLEDLMARNNVYLILREAVGYPQPPNADLLRVQVSEEFCSMYTAC